MASPRKSLLPAALVLLGLVVAGVVLARHIDLRALMTQTIANLREAGPFAFFGAMALLPAVGFPLAAFTVVAGPVFGPTLGLPAVVGATIAAVSVNVALSYWLATRALRPLVVRGVQWLGYELPAVQPHAVWAVVLIVRIVPGPPFFLQSYLLGLARTPFKIYMIVSVIVPSAYLAGTIVLTDALVRGDRGGMAVALGIFLLAGAAIHQLRRRMRVPAAAPATGAPLIAPKS